MSNDSYYSYALLISLLLNNIFIYAIILQIFLCWVILCWGWHKNRILSLIRLNFTLSKSWGSEDFLFQIFHFWGYKSHKSCNWLISFWFILVDAGVCCNFLVKPVLVWNANKKCNYLKISRFWLFIESF